MTRIAGLLFVLLTVNAFGQWQRGAGPISPQMPGLTDPQSFFRDTDSALYAYGNAANGGYAIYVSHDSAKSWKPITSFPNYDCEQLYARSNYIVALGFGGGPCGLGLHVSNDYGNTWSDISAGYPNGAGCQAGLMTVMDSFVYIASGFIVKKNFINPGNWSPADIGLPFGSLIGGLNNFGGNLFVSKQYDRFYFSSSQGLSWTAADSNLLNNSTTQQIRIDSPFIYIYDADINNNFYILKSTAGLYNWVNVPFPSYITALSNFQFTGSNAILSLNTYHNYYSTNNGSTWLSPKNDHKRGVICAQSYPFMNSFLGIAYRGIVLLDRQDSAWRFYSYGYDLKDVADICKSGNKLLAVCRNGGLYSSIDKGKSWTPDYKLTGAKSESMYSYDSLVFVCSKGGVYRSSDYGSSWTFNAVNGINFKQLLKKDSALIAATNNGIYLSNNNGINWVSSATTFSNPVINDLDKNQDTLICATNNGLHKSIDNGQSWSLILNTLKDSAISSVECSASGVFCTTANILYQSGTNGSSFNPIHTSATIISDFLEADSTFILATDSGCFAKKNGSNTWYQGSIFNYPVFNSEYVHKLELIDSAVFAASQLMGISYLTQDTLAHIGIKNNQVYDNIDIFPNPTTGDLHLDLGKQQSSADIEITSSLGQVVYKASYRNIQKIDLSLSYPAKGLYCLKIGLKEAHVVKKLIIE